MTTKKRVVILIVQKDGRFVIETGTVGVLLIHFVATSFRSHETEMLILCILKVCTTRLRKYKHYFDWFVSYKQ